MPSINDLARAAGDPNASVNALIEASHDRSPKVRAAAAENPSTPPDVLARLVEDDRWQVRFAVAENPSLEACRIALSCTDPDVRGLAAQRDDVSTAQVEQILEDPAHSVRERLAEAATDEGVLRRLANDPHPLVRASVALNDAVPVDVLQALAQDGRARVRSAAAASRRLPYEALTPMANDRSVEVQWHVLVSNPERLDLAAQIAEHSDAMNAGQARSQLQHPGDFTGPLDQVEIVKPVDRDDFLY